MISMPEPIFLYSSKCRQHSHACWPKQQLPASLEPEDSPHPEWKAVKDTFCCCFEPLSWLSLSCLTLPTQHTPLIYERYRGRGGGGGALPSHQSHRNLITLASKGVNFLPCDWGRSCQLKTLLLDHKGGGDGFSHKQKQKVREIGQWTGKT